MSAADLAAAVTGLSDGAFTGTVLYADFSDARPSGIDDAPLSHGELLQLDEAVGRAGGAVIENTPRRLLAFFPEAGAALALARGTMEIVTQTRDADPDRRGLDCRVLLGYGPVAFERGRLRSNWTHRLHGQVLRVPQNTIAALPEFAERFSAAELPRKRLTAHLLLVSTPPAAAQARLAPPQPAAARGVFTTLVIHVRATPQTIRSSDCPVKVGRDESCGVQIAGDTVSRVHGRIEFAEDRFFYADSSRNGTYVLHAGGEEAFLRKDRIALVGEGAISPGAPLNEQTGEIIRYRCTAAQLSTAGTDGETKPARR